jgi:RNA polymerase I-specific transcription initiation factor RRN7
MKRPRRLASVRNSTEFIMDNTAEFESEFNGRRAFGLYLKCLQLILRHQIWFLVKDRVLPSELEQVVFDLWAVRIAQLGDRIASGGQENDSQQSQVFNTLESEDDQTTDNERGTISTPKGRDKQLHDTPNLYDCLALCYLGMTTLRIPITPGDIYAWTTDGKMAFRRAIKLLPLAMKDRLPSTYHAVLDPQTMLNYKVFYKTLTNLEISFEKDHGVQWPALNVPLLLFRYIKQLALPLEIYDATQRLAELLGHEFVFRYGGRHRLGIRHLPEAQLIACLIVCVKLFYPFDRVRRTPESASESSAVLMDWKKWCKEMIAVKKKQREGHSGFTTEELTKLKENDVFEMTPNQLDQYLDFYADTFIDDAEVERTKENDDFRNALYGMFPIDDKEHQAPVQLSDGISHASMLDTVKAVHGSMKTAAVVGNESGALRPGQMYPIWKDSQDLPKRADMFFEEAAQLAGFSLDMLIMAVFFTEARIEKWRRKQREGGRIREV